MIKKIKNEVPNDPGCYIYKNHEGDIIYVGKAKNLNKRMTSYFIGSNDAKTQALVLNIKDFEFIVTNTEIEALVLENNLIKKYKPKYNIVLKDDKNYPYIKITNETHPRVIRTREIKKDGAKYFGPYISGMQVSDMIQFLNMEYNLRKCKNIPKKACLYYHIGKCYAPCIQKWDDEYIKSQVEEIENILNGKTTKILTKLNEKMETESNQYNFEVAAKTRDVIAFLNNLNDNQFVQISDKKDFDVVNIHVKSGWITTTTLSLSDGKLVDIANNFISYVNDNWKDMIINFLYDKYLDSNLEKVIINDEYISKVINNIVKPKFKVESLVYEKKLMEMAEKNTSMALKNNLETINSRYFKDGQNKLNELEKLLEIDKCHKIEFFDNSHNQGSNSVSAMITMVEGEFERKLYRKYKVSTRNDDYAAMREVIKRRYKRVIEENSDMPDLIIIDGGIGHIAAVEEVLEELGLVDVNLIGLAKNDKHITEYIVVGWTGEKIMLDHKSNAYFLLKQIQDEGHRFVISFHNQLNKKSLFSSKLDNISGIGPAAKLKILSKFDNIEIISNASYEELISVGLTSKQATNLIEHFKGKHE